MTELNALEQIVGRGASGDRSDPLEFMDEYATVMNRYTQIEVRNGFKEGYADLSLNFGFGDGGLLWLEDGVYCFDEEERGKVQKGGMFNSPSIELTQKVMLNYTVSVLRHALGFESLGLPMDAEELPGGWSLYKAAAARYERLDGPNGERLDFETSGERFCVPLAWLYDVSPSELLHAYMLPYGGPLLRRWLGRPYVR